MVKKKISTSITLSEDVVKALDIIVKEYEGNLPIKSRSRLFEYLTKRIVDEILNDEATFINNVENIKKELELNGYTENTYFSPKGDGDDV